MMGVPPPAIRGFPLGLGGLYADGMFGTQSSFKEVEDWVRELIDLKTEGELSLLYKTLHALGYRIGTVDSAIDKMRKSLSP
jgi:hypothetical protein